MRCVFPSDVVVAASFFRSHTVPLTLSIPFNHCVSIALLMAYAIHAVWPLASMCEWVWTATILYNVYACFSPLVCCVCLHMDCLNCVDCVRIRARSFHSLLLNSQRQCACICTSHTNTPRSLSISKQCLLFVFLTILFYPPFVDFWIHFPFRVSPLSELKMQL